MPACPHCSEKIEHLPGFLTQAALEDRLSSQKTGHETALTAVRLELTTVKNSLTQANTKASGFDAVVSERDGLQAKLTGMEQTATRTTAMQTAGVDPAMREHVELIFNSANAGRDEPLEWDAWMASTEEGGARTHPLLSSQFGTPGTPAVVVPPKNNLPDPNAGKPGLVTPPGNLMPLKDVMSFIRTDEYHALSSDEKNAKLNEMEAAVTPPG